MNQQSPIVRLPVKARELYETYQRQMRELKAMESFQIQQEAVIFDCALDPSKRRNLSLQQVNKPLQHLVEVALPISFTLV